MLLSATWQVMTLLCWRYMRVVKGGPNPISQEIVFFKSQLKFHNPSLCCSNWNPIPILLLFFFFSSAQNPISQPLKKANPSSHFTPSRPSYIGAVLWLAEKNRYLVGYFTRICRTLCKLPNQTWRIFLAWSSFLKLVFFLRYWEFFQLDNENDFVFNLFLV